MGIAKFEIIGRLTRDPECRETQGGTRVARFGTAVNTAKETYFWNIVAFGKQAEFSEKYLKKGSYVRLYGDMRNSKKDGVMYYDLIADSITFMDSGKKEQKEEGQPEDGFMPDETDEEMPF